MLPLPILRRCALSHSCRSASATTPILLDFLIPSTSKHGQCRQASTTAGTPGGSKPLYVLSKEQRDFMDSALRVNQAGELAATLIYKAQTPQIVRSYPHLRPLMKHMYDQEAGHLKTFNHLITKHQIRPTAMYPAWEVAATFLGWSTAALGREAAMACTEAVETEIGSHYNDQAGEELDEELKEMLATLRRIRDEELEHLDHAVANDSKEAKPYDPLVDVIRLGCRTAIKISEKI
ncbi:Ubiquinone biosynthesis protein Coq7 [Penicillium expansum]|nr:Ubiquinone biosynthesis protein Coq7 [Penicillium expansum]